MTSAIGLPDDPTVGLRIGTNEMVRWGLSVDDTVELTDLIVRAFADNDPREVAADVTAFRSRFDTLHFIRRPTA